MVVKLIEQIKKESNLKKRLKFLDIAKGIGIYLVVAEHHGFLNAEYSNWQIIILQFHMPLFFLYQDFSSTLTLVFSNI